MITRITIDLIKLSGVLPGLSAARKPLTQLKPLKQPAAVSTTVTPSSAPGGRANTATQLGTSLRPAK